jgi:hypothetical protein
VIPPSQPSTPIPEPRPFERLATIGSDLPRACWIWLIWGVGAGLWPVVGAPLALIAAMGAWWRVLALRSARLAAGSAGSSLWGRFWAWLALGSAVVGSVTAVEWCVAGIGVPWRPSPGLANACRLLVPLEMLVAAAWVGTEASERRSGWALVMLVLAAAAGLASGGVQVVDAIDTEALAGSRLVLVLTRAVMLGGAAVAVLLLADLVSRLMQALAHEAFDREHASSGSRMP